LYRAGARVKTRQAATDRGRGQARPVGIGFDGAGVDFGDFQPQEKLSILKRT